MSELSVSLKRRKGLADIIDSFINLLSKSVTLNVIVPTNILIRTKLICDYISEEVEVEFSIENFLMIVYLDFIRESIRKYDPLKIYRQLNESFGYNDTIKLTFGDEVYEYNKRECSRTELIIEMDKKDALKGQQLLSELDDLYGRTNITLEKMISTLWINFIENYKRGEHDKALKTIIKMLKQQK